MMPAVLSSTINRGILSLTDRIKHRNPFEIAKVGGTRSVHLHYSVNILHYSGQYKETFNVWDGGAKRAKNVRTNP